MANVGVTFDFAAESAKLRNEIDKVRREVSGLKDTNDGIISSFKSVGIALAGAFSVGAITSQLNQAAKAAISFGDEMQKAAAKTGIGAGDFAALADAARMADIDTTSLSKALQKMQVAISEAGSGSKAQLETFSALGIEFERFRELAPEDQFLKLADQINALQDPADRVRAAVELFGKAGADLLPFFEQGAAGIRKATDEIERLGGKLTDEQIQKLADADDAIKRLDQSWTSFARTLTAKVAPILTSVLNTLSNSDQAQIDAVRRSQIEALLQSRGSAAEMFPDTVALQKELAMIDYRERQRLLGPGRQATRAPAEIVAPGFAAAAASASAAATGRQAAQRSPGDPFAGIDAASNRTLDRALGQFDPTQDLEAIFAEDRYKWREEREAQHQQAMLGLGDQFNQTWLGMVLSNNDVLMQAEEYKNTTIGQGVSELVGIAMQQGGALGKFGKAFAIAQTIWSTGTAIMNAFAQVPYPANIGVAAAIAAKGALQLAQIKKTNIGSGGTVASGGGVSASTGSAALPFSVAATRSTESDQKSAVQIVVNGNLFAAQETVRWMAEQLGDLINGKDMVFIDGNSRQAMELAGT